MQLYFIRHAQSANNLLHDQTGTWANMTDDPELTDTGSRACARARACPRACASS